jgi:hypothetical protein
LFQTLRNLVRNSRINCYSLVGSVTISGPNSPATHFCFCFRFSSRSPAKAQLASGPTRRSSPPVPPPLSSSSSLASSHRLLSGQPCYAVPHPLARLPPRPLLSWSRHHPIASPPHCRLHFNFRKTVILKVPTATNVDPPP